MLIRIWRTGIDTARLAEYATFEREQSLPMFQRQPGLLGVLFLREGDDRAAALTIWEDEGAVQALDSSASYASTVTLLLSAGLLKGEQSVEVFGCAGGHIDAEALITALGSTELRP